MADEMIHTLSEPTIDVDRKASREYIFGKKKESPKARCCKCGTECDKSMMAWVGDGVYKCKMCILMRRNDG